MATSQLEAIMTQAQHLSLNEQAMLIKRLTDLLVETKLTKSDDVEAKEENEAPQYLIYGEFHDAPGRMSTEEDFRIAEWHPTEKDLNGE